MTARISEVKSLPVTLNVPMAAEILGISAGLGWKLVREGKWPSPVLHFGRKVLIPTAPFLKALGLKDGKDEEQGPSL